MSTSTYQRMMTTLHQEAINILQEDENHRCINGEENYHLIKDFDKTLGIYHTDSDMYRVLYLDLYRMTKGITITGKITVQTTMKEVRKCRPVRRYYRLIRTIVKHNLQPKIWQLQQQNKTVCVLCEICNKNPCEICNISNDVCTTWNCTRCDKCEERIQNCKKCECHKC